MTLPAPAVQALHSTLGHLAKGNSVRIVALPAEYSVKEAAELLGLPPKFVLREIDAGRLRFRQAGRQKRVGADDLEAYRVRLQKRRRRALHELTALSQRMKLEY